MAADRRVAYQLTIAAGKSLKTLADLTREAHAAAAAIAALDEAQAKANASAAALSMARPSRARPAGGATSSGAAAAADPEAAARKEAAAQLRAEARARAVADREYERQRQASIRQELGAIDGKAELERERIERLRAQLAEQGRLGEKETDLIERRLRFINEDAERQRESLSKRGVDPRQAFGATGTRQTTIGSGVLSGFFDKLFTDLDGGGAKLDGLRDAAGRADASLKTLAGALGVVSPAAGAAATAAGDLVGSLEVLLTPAGATVGAMAAVGVALGVAGAAAVAATLHLAEVGDELAALDAAGAPTLVDPEDVERAKDAAAAISALRPAFSALAGVIAGQVAPAIEDFAVSAVAAVLLIRRGLESVDLEGIFEHLAASVVKNITLPIEAALRAVALLAEAGNDLQEAVGRRRDPLVESVAEGARAAVAELEEFQRRAGRALVDIGRDTVTGYAVGLRAATAEVREEAEALVDAVRATSTKTDAGGAGGVSLSGGVETDLAEVNDAIDVAADAMERLQEILNDERTATATPFEKLTAQFEEARLELEALRVAAGPAGAALAEAAGKALDVQEARQRAALVEAGVEEANREIAARDAAARAAVEERAARPGEAVDRFGGTVGQLEQGNVVGGLGAATGVPQVKVVGEALGALARLGELGTEELRTRGEDFAEAVGEGLRILPALIIDVLPDLVVALVMAIGDALADLPAKIAEAIRAALKGESGDGNTDPRRGATRGAVAGAAAGAIALSPFIGPAAGVLLGAATGAAAGATTAAVRGAFQSRAAAESDLAGGVTLPRTGSGRGLAGEGGAVIMLRGNGVGVSRAIDLDATGAYTGRTRGVRP